MTETSRPLRQITDQPPAPDRPIGEGARERAKSTEAYAKARELYTVLNAIRVPRLKSSEDQHDALLLIAEMSRSLAEHGEVLFVLPAFPFKSRNTVNKVLGPLPDKAEELAMAQLMVLEKQLTAIAPVKIILAMDGFTYADILNIPTSDVRAYASEVMKLHPHPQAIEWFDYHESDEGVEDLQKTLDTEFAPSLRKIQNRIKRDARLRHHYAGLKRFWLDDLDDGTGSRKSKEKAAKEIALKMIVRNAAYSRYLKTKFPNAVRLSIHGSNIGTGRYHINLLPENNLGGAPWHNVALKTREGWKLIKRKDADAKGYRLVYENDRPSYYAEGE